MQRCSARKHARPGAHADPGPLSLGLGTLMPASTGRSRPCRRASTAARCACVLALSSSPS